MLTKQSKRLIITKIIVTCIFAGALSVTIANFRILKSPEIVESRYYNECAYVETRMMLNPIELVLTTLGGIDVIDQPVYRTFRTAVYSFFGIKYAEFEVSCEAPKVDDMDYDGSGGGRRLWDVFHRG